MATGDTNHGWDHSTLVCGSRGQDATDSQISGFTELGRAHYTSMIYEALKLTAVIAFLAILIRMRSTKIRIWELKRFKSFWCHFAPCQMALGWPNVLWLCRHKDCSKHPTGGTQSDYLMHDSTVSSALDESKTTRWQVDSNKRLAWRSEEASPKEATRSVTPIFDRNEKKIW